MKVESKIQLEQRLKHDARQRIKDCINEKKEIQIKNFKNKNKTRNEKSIKNLHTTDRQKYNNLQHNVFHNNTQVNTNPQHFPNTKIEELNNFENSSDYEAMWEIAIDKWTRNWNFYRERLTDSILEKFGKNNKRLKRQTNIDFVELTGQNINGSATGPQDIFTEHYDCDAEEITNVKYYDLNKINTCKFQPLDLDMTKTEVQLLSKAQAVEIKAYAVAGTIKERVEWCSQDTDYIRANRPSCYVSDAQRTKILDADEVRNKLARINFLKNTRYKPTRYNVSFNYVANPPLQKRYARQNTIRP